MKPRCLVILMLVPLMNCAYPVDKVASETPVKDDGSAVVTWGSLSPAVGHFLLVRHGKEFCAIKYTAAWRGNDAKPPTMFNSDEESFRTEYDWYYTLDYPKQWGTTEVRSGHGEVRRGALKGIGRLAFQTADGELECGSMKFSWDSPSTTYFFVIGGGRKKQGDQGYEMALTKWRTVQEIKPDAPYLKWYRYDENREPITLRTEDLW